MEKDNEVKGNGNSYTTEFRQYDPRLGRWLSLDPMMESFPWMSPFVAFDNNPVYFVDPYGLASEGGPGKGSFQKSKHNFGKADRTGKNKAGKGEKNGKKGKETPADDSKNLPKTPLDPESYRPEGLPNEGVDGQIGKDNQGRDFTFIVNEQGQGYWVTELDEVVITPKEEKSKAYSWMKGATLDNFFGHTPTLSLGSSPYHDNINEQPAHIQADWRRQRANSDAIDRMASNLLLNSAATGLTLGIAPGLSIYGRFLYGSASNTFNQLAYNNFDYKQIDLTNVIGSGLVTGLVPSVYGGGWKGMAKPVFKVISINLLDASSDFSVKDKLEMIYDGTKNPYKALNDFGFGVGGAFVPSASPLIPYQIQMAPSSFMLYGINYSINKTYFPSKK